MDPATLQLKLEEYKGWLESMRQSEEIGEKRLQFFVTLATAVLGGVMALAKAKGGDFDIDVSLAAELASWALPALLIFGVLTFFRMLRRDSQTDRCKHELDQIRALFPGGDAKGGNGPGGAGLDPTRTHPRTPRQIHHGGLTAIMLTANAVLFGAWLGVLSAVPGYPLNPGGLFLGFGAAWAVGAWCRWLSEERRGLWAKDDQRKPEEKSKRP